MTESILKSRRESYYTLVRVLLFYVLSVALLLFTSRITKTLPAKSADLLSIAIACFLTFGLVVLFVKWEKLSLKTVGVIPGAKSANRFALGYAMGLAMAGTQALIVLMSGHLKLILNPRITVTEVGLSCLLYLLVACREELAFRSYFLKSIAYSFNVTTALLIMTVIFIFEHVIAGMSWKMAAIGSGFGGILFGISAIKSNGLALPFGLHSAWNFGQWSMGFKNKVGIWEAVVEKGYEVETETIGLIGFSIAMSLGILFVYLLYKTKNEAKYP